MTDQPAGEAKVSASEDPEKKPEPIDQLVETDHVLDLPDGELAYTARTGRVVLREEVYEEGRLHRLEAAGGDGGHRLHPRRGDVTERPVCFVFNGGPGSASVWLHLGLLGPRRVHMGDVGALVPPPYGLVDNAETLLRDADLVFIDPMSTGHTRAVEGGKAKDYHGFGKDVEQVAELIRLWCTREDRWMSPKYLIGESYGTVRAVGRGRAALEHPHDGLQRPGAGLERARLRLAGLQLPPQRRGVRQLPADLRRDRPLPRPARGALAQRGRDRGAGVRRRPVPLGARPGDAADRRASGRTSWPRSPG